MKRTVFYLFLLFILGVLTRPLSAQQQRTFTYGVELLGTGSSDDYLPFWLYSNRHGTIDYNSPGSNAILQFHKNITNSGFDYGFGTTLVGRYSENETVFFSELYGSLAYGVLRLKGGRYYETLGTTDESLSMGSLAISPNATPMPKIALGIPQYTDVPLTHGWVEFKAEIAHGWFEEDRQIKSPWLHQKYAYLRFGGDLAFRPYVGLTHQATWAGTGRRPVEGDLDDSFADFWRVFFAYGAEGDDNSDGEVAYTLGDHRGVWDFGFNLTLSDIDFLVYRQYIYNDKDGLQLRNPDQLTGVSVRLPSQHQQLVTGLLWEYMYTKEQSGPIPPPGNMRGGPGGRDNYYNNYLYRTGWTYFGRTIGNPLFLNAYDPQLGIVSNDQVDPNKRYGIVNNRIVAHHFGIEGKFSEILDYKLLATWSRNYGLYYDQDLLEREGLRTDFIDNPEQWSFLAKFSYHPFDPLRLNLSLAGDVGELYEDRIGIMLGIQLLGSSPF